MDGKLQIKFGTKRIEFRTRSSVMATDPISATLDNDLLAIQTIRFPELGL